MWVAEALYFGHNFAFSTTEWFKTSFNTLLWQTSCFLAELGKFFSYAISSQRELK